MRSGRLDRKIEFPHPSEEARARILQVLFGLLFSAIVFLHLQIFSAVIRTETVDCLFVILDPLEEDECPSRCQL